MAITHLLRQGCTKQAGRQQQQQLGLVPQPIPQAQREERGRSAVSADPRRFSALGLRCSYQFRRGGSSSSSSAPRERTHRAALPRGQSSEHLRVLDTVLVPPQVHLLEPLDVGVDPAVRRTVER